MHNETGLSHVSQEDLLRVLGLFSDVFGASPSSLSKSLNPLDSKEVSTQTLDIFPIDFEALSSIKRSFLDGFEAEIAKVFDDAVSKYQKSVENHAKSQNEDNCLMSIASSISSSPLKNSIVPIPAFLNYTPISSLNESVDMSEESNIGVVSIDDPNALKSSPSLRKVETNSVGRPKSSHEDSNFFNSVSGVFTTPRSDHNNVSEGSLLSPSAKTGRDSNSKSPFGLLMNGSRSKIALEASNPLNYSNTPKISVGDGVANGSSHGSPFKYTSSKINSTKNSPFCQVESSALKSPSKTLDVPRSDKMSIANASSYPSGKDVSSHSYNNSLKTLNDQPSYPPLPGELENTLDSSMTQRRVHDMQDVFIDLTSIESHEIKGQDQIASSKFVDNEKFASLDVNLNKQLGSVLKNSIPQTPETLKRIRDDNHGFESAKRRDSESESVDFTFRGGDGKFDHTIASGWRNGTGDFKYANNEDRITWPNFSKPVRSDNNLTTFPKMETKSTGKMNPHFGNTTGVYKPQFLFKANDTKDSSSFGDLKRVHVDNLQSGNPKDSYSMWNSQTSFSIFRKTEVSNRGGKKTIAAQVNSNACVSWNAGLKCVIQAGSTACEFSHSCLTCGGTHPKRFCKF